MTSTPQPARRHFAVVDWNNGQIEVMDSFRPFRLGDIVSTSKSTPRVGQVVSLHDTHEEAEAKAEASRRAGT